MPKPVFIGHDIYQPRNYAAGHPLSIPRVSVAMDLMRAEGWLDKGNYRESRQATVEELSDFHDPAYLAALQRAEMEEPGEADKKRFNIGLNGNPLYPEMFRRPATSCGGGLMAADILASGETDVVYNIAGGQHHGQANRASGFCFLNEPALTIRKLKRLGARRVFYLDIDAHFGDGVQTAFHDDDSVFTLSIHEDGRWPMIRDRAPGDPGSVEDRAGGMARNLPVPQGLNDTELGYLMETVALPLITEFEPDVVYLQAGCDALADDPQSKLALSNQAIWAAVSAVQAKAPRLLVSGGGGYNPYAVGRCWAGVWATLGQIEIPARLSPLSQAHLRAICWPHRKGRKPPERWFSQLADIPHEGPVRDDVRRLVEKCRAV